MAFTAKDMQGISPPAPPGMSAPHVYPDKQDLKELRIGRLVTDEPVEYKAQTSTPKIRTKVSKKIKQDRAQKSVSKKGMKGGVLSSQQRIMKKLKQKTKAQKAVERLKGGSVKGKGGKTVKPKPMAAKSSSSYKKVQQVMNKGMKKPAGFELYDEYTSGEGLVFKHKNKKEFRIIPKTKNFSLHGIEKIVHDLKRRVGLGDHHFSIHVDKPCKSVLPGMARSLVDTYDRVHFTDSPLSTARLRQIIKESDDNLDDVRKSQLAKNISAVAKAGIAALNKKRKRGDAGETVAAKSARTHSTEVPDLSSTHDVAGGSFETKDHNPTHVRHEDGEIVLEPFTEHHVWYGPYAPEFTDMYGFSRPTSVAHANAFQGNIASYGMPGHMSHAMNAYARDHVLSGGSWKSFWRKVRKPLTQAAGAAVGGLVAAGGCALTGLETGGLGCAAAGMAGQEAGQAVSNAIYKKFT